MSSGDIEFSCFDRGSILVTCAKSQWIYLAKHKEVVGRQRLVKAVIENPDSIRQSKKHKKRRTLYKVNVFPQLIGRPHIRVVVEYRKKPLGEMRGYVINAFSCKGVQDGEVLIWERQTA